MAKNVDEAISEEEERELEEADDLVEQEQDKEYADEGGESTAPTTGVGGKSYLEFVCTNCGKRSLVKHPFTTGFHCGKRMTLVDHQAKESLSFARPGVKPAAEGKSTKKPVGSKSPVKPRSTARKR